MHAAPQTAAGNPLTVSAWQLTAMTIVVCTGFSSQMLVPIWIGQVIEKFTLSAHQAGTIASIEFMSVAGAINTPAPLRPDSASTATRRTDPNRTGCPRFCR